MAESRLNLSFYDFDKETGTFGVRGAVIDDTNHAAQALLMDDLKTAVQGLSIGELHKEDRVFNSAVLSVSAAATKQAQRETKWLVTYYDSATFKYYTTEIPCADLSLLDDTSEDPNTRKTLDITAGAGLTFKDAFEAYVLSPTGNAVVVESVKNVGRNI